MSERKTLKPAAGRKVRRPDGAHLADSGEEVILCAYWHRRLADGDVVEVAVVRAPAKPAAATKRERE